MNKRIKKKKHYHLTLIDNAMKNFYNTSGITYSDILKYLIPVKGLLYKEYELLVNDDNDYRSGEDTYGFDNIRGDLSYISDRWRASFRVRWVLDLIEKLECGNIPEEIK